MHTLTIEQRRELAIDVSIAQKTLDGFLKPWKIESIISQVNDQIKYKSKMDTMSFFANCMEMEGFNQEGIRIIHNLVIKAFTE